MRFNLLTLSAFLVLYCSYPVTALAQDNKDEKKVSQVKLRKARHYFLANDVRGALTLYEELYRQNPDHTEVNYRLGECHYALKNYSTALPMLEKAYSQDKDEDDDLPYLLGRVYHRLGKLDEAEKVFSEIKSNPDQTKENKIDADRFLNQVRTAREMIKNPVPVEIELLGENINSSFDEYGPSLSADGSTLTFTSRRPDTEGGGIEINDGKFYEDIYIANWDSATGNWGVAASAPGRLNSEFHDASLSISPDGRQIFIYKNTKETRSGDIWLSRVNMSGNWSSPRPLPRNINSTYFESSASLSADGNWLYFVSEQRGGRGMGDIYRSKRISRSEWSDPENLGPVINTPEDEIAVFIHPDGKTLFFSSEGHNSMGGYDIFKSVFENGSWSIPQNIGYPINTLGDDLHFTLSADQLTGYYSNELPGGMGGRDIYRIDFSEYSLTTDPEDKKGSGLSILRGNVFESEAAQAMEVDITVSDSLGNQITTISSGSEGGYFVTLPGGKEYVLTFNLPGFEHVKERIMLPLDEKGTFVLVRHFIIDLQNKKLTAD